MDVDIGPTMLVKTNSNECSEADLEISLNIDTSDELDFKTSLKIDSPIEVNGVKDEEALFNGKEEVDAQPDENTKNTGTTEVNDNGSNIADPDPEPDDEHPDNVTSISEGGQLDLVITDDEENGDGDRQECTPLSEEMVEKDAARTNEETESGEKTPEIDHLADTSNKNEDDTDLLLVMDERAADLDETEYKESVIADEEDELHDALDQASPPASIQEESLDKTDRNSPDELMDIGDNIVEDGQAANSADDPVFEENADDGPAEEVGEVDTKIDNSGMKQLQEDDMDVDVEGVEEEEVVKKKASANREPIISDGELLDVAGGDSETVNSDALPEIADDRSTSPTVVNSDSKCNKSEEESILKEDSVDDQGTECNKENIKAEGLPPPLVAIKTNTEFIENESGELNARRKRKSVEPNENVKKLKLEGKTPSSSLLNFMLDKSLKGLSVEKLEAFALQKICESLTYKTQVAELRKIIRDKEATIDALRKEVLSISKQAKDIYVVHEKIVQDLNRFKKCPDRPLLIPRITRSVGLQATSREANRLISKGAGANIPPSQQLAVLTKSAKAAVMTNKSSAKGAKQTTSASPKTTASTTPTRILPKLLLKTNAPQPIGNKTTKVSPQKDTKAAGNGVIDLTSDDERRIAIPATKVANGQKYVMVQKQPMMVKVIATSSNSAPTTKFSILKPVNNDAIYTNARPGVVVTARPQTKQKTGRAKHPAPFPPNLPLTKLPLSASALEKPIPPKPHLSLSKTPCGSGIVLTWKMPYRLEMYEEIQSYQLYAYQETAAEPSPDNWSKIGDVKALPLPMAVTLSQFPSCNRYYFAVRAVDSSKRQGVFSDYQTLY